MYFVQIQMKRYSWGDMFHITMEEQIETGPVVVVVQINKLF